MKDLDGFRCHTCGLWHEGVPLDYSYDSPHYWSEELKSDLNSFHNSDFCVIRRKYFFIKGVIEIPVIGHSDRFSFGVWVSLREQNFQRMVDISNDPAIVEEPAYFGWLSNSIDLYTETLNLKTNVKHRGAKLRPYIELEPTDHLLAIEQRNGITWDRVREIAERTMHRK